MITILILPTLIGAVLLLLLLGCVYLWARHPEIVMIVMFVIFIIIVSWVFGVVFLECIGKSVFENL